MNSALRASLFSLSWKAASFPIFCRRVSQACQYSASSETGLAVGLSTPHSTGVLVAVAAERTPPALLKQLKPGGRLILPVGYEEVQLLTVIDKDAAGQLEARKLIPVRFSRLEAV